MSTSGVDSQHRTKQACNSCRRKKTKCPGQKPRCSTCQRLGQVCSYGSTQDENRVSKSPHHEVSHSYAEDRFKRLEHRLEQLYHVIGTIGVNIPPDDDGVHVPASESTTQCSTDDEHSVLRVAVIQGGLYDENKCPEPGQDILDDMIAIYKEYIDHRPLPLLDVEDLSSAAVTQWPLHLRRSFLAATISFCDHPFYAGSQGQALSYYLQSARDAAMKAMWKMDDVSTVCQSFCLLAETDIRLANATAARMDTNLGIAFAKSAGYFDMPPRFAPADAEETRSRYIWSLLVLDLIYNSSNLLTDHMVNTTQLSFPRSVQTPTAATLSEGSGDEQLLSIQDLGITAYCLQLFTIWGDLMSFVKHAERGRAVEPWLNTSKYHEINAKLYQFETKLAQTHRFQQTNFTKRTAIELKDQSQYWGQWLMMQFILHALQALLNHPFIHIAGQRTMFQPPSFLQSTVDQATLHVCWILKLIDACRQQNFDLQNPFIGHLVSITATVFLFLLKSRNRELASQASNGYNVCIEYIVKLSEQWGHLQHTVEKLKILHHGANASSLRPGRMSASNVQSSLLWELLDYSTSTSATNVQEMASDVVDLNVNTTFLSPIGQVEPSHVQQRRSTYRQEQSLENSLPSLADNGAWEQVSNEPIWNLFAAGQMADFTQFSPDRNLWNFGQL